MDKRFIDLASVLDDKGLANIQAIKQSAPQAVKGKLFTQQQIKQAGEQVAEKVCGPDASIRNSK